MIFIAVVLGCLGAFILLCRWLANYVDGVVTKQTHQEERISSLEVKDYAQDARLDAHRKAIIQAKKDIKALGKDVGWDDSNRATQVMDTKQVVELTKKMKEPPDEPPPNAA